jgi:hypothetical protein
MSAPDLSFNLKYVHYHIWSDRRLVRTTLKSNLHYYCDGTRDETDWRNIREANSQGYTGSDCVWRSLVEHELLHSLVAEYLFNQPSRVMLAESGVQFTPTWERYEEEALVVAAQRYYNTKTFPKVLTVYQYWFQPRLNLINVLDTCRDKYLSQLINLYIS